MDFKIFTMIKNNWDNLYFEAIDKDGYYWNLWRNGLQGNYIFDKSKETFDENKLREFLTPEDVTFFYINIEDKIIDLLLSLNEENVKLGFILILNKYEKV